jgi:hypothetical protein
VYSAQLVALLDLINSEAACLLHICLQLLTLLYATLLTLLYATATSCHTHHHRVGAGVKQKHKVFASGQSLLRLQHCSRPAHADAHFRVQQQGENLQAKERADAGQCEGQTAGISDDMQAEWRTRAGSALDDLRAEKQEQYDSLNIQASC